MSAEEIRAFLLEGTRTGKLATLTPSGHPHVMPIWFVLDGDDIVFTTGEDTIKGKHILSDGRVAMAVDDERPPYSFVHVRGTAVGELDTSDLLEWTTRIARRYVGDDEALAYGRRNAVPTELLVRLTPERVIAVQAVAD